MSKSITNQRLIYKINSERFRYNNWNLNLDFNEAKKNEEVISIDDSIALRMIRHITKNNVTDKEIKKLKKKKVKEKNIEKYSKYCSKINELTFEPNIINIVFNTIDDWNKANSKNYKVVLNGVEYVRLIGTNGGIKNNVVIFVNKDIHKELDRRLNNDRNVNRKYVPAKFESYKALSFSTSTEVTQPRRILVIRDGIVNIKEDVLRLSDNGKGGFDLNEVKDYEIEKQFCDGCGMISPRLAEQWAIDLGEFHYDENGNKVANYIPSGFNTRMFSEKGILATFPFVEYGDEIGEYLVEDIWGDMVDIRDVDVILTNNMLKLWDGFDNYDDFISKCEKNGFKLCVAKILPKELEKTRNMNYQFLQSYDFTDEDIKELIKPTVDSIKGACGVNEFNEIDYGKMLLFLQGNKISEKDFERCELDYIKALMINKEMMNDPFVKQKVHKMIKKKIEDSKKGVIKINGNYSIIIGDLYALCQYMFKKPVTGLFKKGQFYSRTWLDMGVDKVVAYRSPMTIHNNIRIMRFVENEKIKKYYRYITVCTVLNAWDTTTDALNGAD